MVDARDSKSRGPRGCEGSSPSSGTNLQGFISVDRGLGLMEVVEELGAFSERFLVHVGISPVNLFGLMAMATERGTPARSTLRTAVIVELETTFQNQRAR